MLTVQVQGLSLNSGAVVENSCTIWASIGVKGLIWEQEECGKQGICGILLTSFGPQIHIWVKIEIPQRKLAETRSKGQSLSQLGWTGLAPGPAEDRNEHQEPGLEPCCQAVQTPGVSHGGCSPVPKVPLKVQSTPHKGRGLQNISESHSQLRKKLLLHY